MKRCGVLLVFFLLSLTVFGQRVPLSAFKDSLLPSAGAGDLYSINQSAKRFEVSLDHDTLKVIMNNDSTPQRLTTFQLRNGSLMGYDNGDAGGYLVRVFSNGRSDTVFRGPVEHIFSCYGRLFFTSGVWRQNQHYGQLFMLDTSNNNTQAKIYSTFDYPIRRCHVTKDSMYLVSYGILYRMQYGKPVTITTLPFVCTSMTTQGRYMYFGMRGGYARLDMKSKLFRYFVYTGQ